MSNDDVRNLIVDLRGGIPDKCSFCANPTEPQNLHPEEAGEWICNECIKRMGYGGGGEGIPFDGLIGDS